MGRIVHWILFGVLTLGALYGGHRYVWTRLVRDAVLPRAWKRALGAILVVLALSIPAAFYAGRQLAGVVHGVMIDVAWTWLAFVFYAVFLLAGVDLAHWIVKRVVARFETRGAGAGAAPDERVPAIELEEAAVEAIETDPGTEGKGAEELAHATRSTAHVDVGRRAFLARSIAGAVTVGAGGTILLGRRSAEEITTPEVVVRLERLPRALQGFTIVQMSDIHFGPLLRARFLERLVDVANAQKPDAIVITGDMVDAPASRLARELVAMTKLRARHGVFFATGNHEYYSDAEEWLAWLRGASVKALVNERVSLGDAGASFDLAGVPDAQGGLFLPDHAVDYAKALAGRDPERELVLLAHRPSQVVGAAARFPGTVGLQLSGHTHGGQMWPFGALVRMAEPYLAGLHRHDDRTQIYVSRGTGFWGPPVRVLSPPEVTRIVLV